MYVNHKFSQHSCMSVLQVVLQNSEDFNYSSKYDRVIFIETLGGPDTYEVMQHRMAVIFIPTSTSCSPTVLHDFVIWCMNNIIKPMLYLSALLVILNPEF